MSLTRTRARTARVVVSLPPIEMRREALPYFFL
jgi:hypothetical protein